MAFNTVAAGVLRARALPATAKDANKAGGAEALKQASRTGQISLSEAQKILGIESGAAWDQIEKKYEYLYKVNSDTSHYLLSKVYRAKERLNEEYPDEVAKWKEKAGDPGDQTRV